MSSFFFFIFEEFYAIKEINRYFGQMNAWHSSGIMDNMMQECERKSFQSNIIFSIFLHRNFHRWRNERQCEGEKNQFGFSHCCIWRITFISLNTNICADRKPLSGHKPFSDCHDYRFEFHFEVNICSANIAAKWGM